MGILDRKGGMLDKIFGRTQHDYICFYDQNGIVEKGLWIVLRSGANAVFKVLPDPIFGDMMLAIDRNKQPIRTYEEMEHHNPDPQYIVAIAIISPEEPEDYQAFIANYFSYIKRAINDNKQDMVNINEYNKSVYLHLIDKLSDCRIQVVKGATMTKTGRT